MAKDSEGEKERGFAPPQLGDTSLQEAVVLYAGRKSLIRNFAGMNGVQEKDAVLRILEIKIISQLKCTARE